VALTAAASSTIKVDSNTTIDPARAQAGTPFTATSAASSLTGADIARKHCAWIEAELAHTRGRRWVLATGYINLWCRIHRAEEALIDVGPCADVIQGALHDELRLMGSNISNRDDLLGELRAAVYALSPAAAAALLKLPPHQVSTTVDPLPPDQARSALRHVSNAVNTDRDNNWDGLVRVRNHLNTAIFFTGLFTYVLLAFVISQLRWGDPGAITAIASVTGLYLIGAIVGLFNQLAFDANADTAVEDYNLFLARLLNTSLFSGLAAVFGVALTVMLPTVVVPTAAAAAAKHPGVLQLIDVFNLQKYPLDPVIAAVFGLTPNLLISRLTDQAAKFKANISSTEPVGHS
jgi:hypothetical protein